MARVRAGRLKRPIKGISDGTSGYFGPLGIQAAEADDGLFIPVPCEAIVARLRS
jgi:hypothetical protein